MGGNNCDTARLRKAPGLKPVAVATRFHGLKPVAFTVVLLRSTFMRRICGDALRRATQVGKRHVARSAPVDVVRAVVRLPEGALRLRWRIWELAWVLSTFSPSGYSNIFSYPRKRRKRKSRRRGCYWRSWSRRKHGYTAIGQDHPPRIEIYNPGFKLNCV